MSRRVRDGTVCRWRLRATAPRLFAAPAQVYAETLSFLELAPFETTYEVHNARSYSKIEPHVQQWLSEQFALSNERLVNILGPDFEFRR